MESLLAKVGSHAMNMAIRSGLGLTTAYAMSQYSRLLSTVDDEMLLKQLKTLELKLEVKMKIVGPAIDLIELRSGRGNIFLDSALPLARDLHQNITSLGRHLEDAASCDERLNASKPNMRTRHRLKAKAQSNRPLVLESIINDLAKLLDDIDQSIPLLQLAITASGESLSSGIPTHVSPSRLLQASTLLIMGDTRYLEAQMPTAIGPNFYLLTYMLFLGHLNAQDEPRTPPHSPHENTPIRKDIDTEIKPMWQEVMHKSRVRIVRLPFGAKFDRIKGYVVDTNSQCRPDEYTYHLEIIENLDDGRAHERATKYASYQDISAAGIRESVPLYQISKIFYTYAGRLLNIGPEDGLCNNPVLLLKRDLLSQRTECRVQYYEKPDSLLSDEEGDDTASSESEQGQLDEQLQVEVESEIQKCEKTMCFPAHLDPEWIAFEVFSDGGDDDDDDDILDKSDTDDRDSEISVLHPEEPSSLDLSRQFHGLSLGAEPHSEDNTRADNSPRTSIAPNGAFGSIQTSLSLMEMLVRLAGLQESEQTCHLATPDSILSFFLDESSTTGFTGQETRRVREEARQRVGFDPYVGTPTKSSSKGGFGAED